MCSNILFFIQFRSYFLSMNKNYNKKNNVGKLTEKKFAIKKQQQISINEYKIKRLYERF